MSKKKPYYLSTSTTYYIFKLDLWKGLCKVTFVYQIFQASMAPSQDPGGNKSLWPKWKLKKMRRFWLRGRPWQRPRHPQSWPKWHPLLTCRFHLLWRTSSSLTGKAKTLQSQGKNLCNSNGMNMNWHYCKSNYKNRAECVLIYSTVQSGSFGFWLQLHSVQAALLLAASDRISASVATLLPEAKRYKGSKADSRLSPLKTQYLGNFSEIQ